MIRSFMAAAIMLAALPFSFVFGQSPEKMSFQAVIRNSNNNLVVNSSVGMKISILQGSSTGTEVYSETHSATTNANGLVSVEIGGGSNPVGSISTINWSSGPYFIKTETDPAGGTSYSITSTTQFLSVPFALYAKSSGNGPAGPTGPTGAVGPTGLLSVNCLECHNHDHGSGSGYEGSLAQARDRNKEAYKFSAHGIRLHHLYAGQNAGCAYCHAHDAYVSRVQNNAQPTYTYNSGTGKYTYSFNAPASVSSALPALPGRISCWTCHSGAAADSMSLLLTADSIGLALWASPSNAKYAQIPQDQQSLTCVACHQARPITYNSKSGNGSNVLDSLLVNMSTVVYDSTLTDSTGNIFNPGYRSGGHYGWPGNIFLGVGFGPAEVPGSMAYENSSHTTDASCVICHMATPTANSSNYYTGGHTFSAYKSFKGCNASCHSNMSATHTDFVTATTTQKALLDSLGNLLYYNGLNLMMIDTMPFDEDHYATAAAPEGNMWYKLTTKHFNGYFNIYDATYNKSTNTFKATNGSAGAYKKWPTITKGQLACMFIFQACLREYSGGIHNPKYTTALLTNAIEYMNANPIQ